MTWAYILSYKVVILSKGKIKIPDLQNTRWSLLKREEGTYHHNEKLTMEMPGFLSSRKGVSLLLIPDYSGINKGQSFPDRSNPAHRKPPVKCILTFCLWFPLKSFRVVGLTLRSLIHFGFIFLCGVTKCSSFILLHVVEHFAQQHVLKRLCLCHCIFVPPLSKITCA